MWSKASVAEFRHKNKTGGSDVLEMSVLKIGRILEAIAEHAVYSDVGEPNQKVGQERQLLREKCKRDEK